MIGGFFVMGGDVLGFAGARSSLRSLAGKTFLFGQPRSRFRSYPSSLTSLSRAPRTLLGELGLLVGVYATTKDRVRFIEAIDQVLKERIHRLPAPQIRLLLLFAGCVCELGLVADFDDDRGHDLQITFVGDGIWESPSLREQHTGSLS